MPNTRQPLVGIDIGSTHVSVVVGDPVVTTHGLRDTQILGFTRTHNSGSRRGAIVDFAALTDAISDAIDEVERQTGLELLRARISVAGVQSLSENVVVENGTIKSGEVTESDVEKFLENMQREKSQNNFECIHRLLCYFKVDDLSQIESPIGLSGITLGARMHRVMVQHSEALNLVKACNQCGVRVDGFAFEPLAAAECVLDEDEKDLGVASINLGFEQTHVAVYTNGFPVFSKVYPIGANHITKDLSVGLRTMLTEAERIKREFGHACSGGYEGLDKIVMLGTNGVQRFVNRNEIVRIINPRVQELFEKIQTDLRTALVADLLRKGVVLSGGGAQLRGLCIVAEECFGQPARVAIPTHIGGLVEGLRSPASATLVGLLAPSFSNIFGSRNSLSNSEHRAADQLSFFGSLKRIFSRKSIQLR